MTIPRPLILLAVAVVVALFAAFVWPTRWWYQHVDRENILRVDRLTGDVYVFSSGEGWLSLMPKAATGLRDPTPEELKQFFPELSKTE